MAQLSQISHAESLYNTDSDFRTLVDALTAMMVREDFKTGVLYDAICLAEYKSRGGGQEVRRTKFPLVKMVHYFDKHKAWRLGQVVKETKTSVIVYTAYREKEIVPRDKIIREEFVTPDRAFLKPDRK